MNGKTIIVVWLFLLVVLSFIAQVYFIHKKLTSDSEPSQEAVCAKYVSKELAKRNKQLDELLENIK